MLAAPNVKFRNRAHANQSNVLVRGQIATNGLGSAIGQIQQNKKAQVGLLAVRDFLASPYQGEPPRTEQFLKELLEESNMKFVLQETDNGQVSQPAGGCFSLSMNFTGESI